MKLRKRLMATDGDFDRALRTLGRRITQHDDYEPVGKATAVQKRLGGSLAWVLTAHVEKEIEL